MIRALYRLGTDYRLFVVLCVLLAFVMLEYFALASVNSSVDNALTGIRQRSVSMKLGSLEKKLEELNQKAKAERILTFNREQARQWFIENLEEFRQNYGATITSRMNAENGAFHAKMNFRFTPVEPEDFIRLAEYMENSNAPVIRIEKTAFTERNDERSVTFSVEFIQPFLETEGDGG
ncbi:hypothetical protein [Limisalsivibrio acetivorans]|uniref:hypothetical protein n=1 Tax=Limisalsivibrio acetivorans TaxID=1304888 RepID=UPI0003B49F9B|nr:hypothetical protein [Limisalsivibrio acetivorans]